MKIIINALSASSGGGIAVAVAYCSNLSRNYDVHLVIYAENKSHHEIVSLLDGIDVSVHVLPNKYKNILYRTVMEGVAIRPLLNDHRDILIQLNGLCPLIRHHTGKICLLIQDPSPYVSATFGNARSSFASYFRRWLQGWSIKRCDFLLWTSEYIKDLVLAHHDISNSMGFVVYNGIDPTSAKPKSKTSGLIKTCKLVTLGNVNKYKGQELVVRSLPLLKKKFSDLEYHIVGACDKEYSDHLKSLCRELNVLDNVFFHGRVSETAKYSLLKQCDVFLLLSSCESFGIPVIEAQLMALPVVTSHYTALPEILGIGGVVVNPDDPEQIADTVTRILHDEVFRNLIIDLGIENCSKYTWDSVFKKIKIIFDGDLKYV